MNIDVRRGQDAPPPGLRAGGGVRGGEARRPLAALRLRLGARGHPALRVRLPRLHLQRLQPGRAPLRQRRQQPLAVQRRPYFDLLEKETNSELNTFEKREQQVLRRERLPPGHVHARATRSPLSFHRSQDERRRGVALRRERLPGAAGQRIGSAAPARGRPPTTSGLAGDGHLGPHQRLPRRLLRVRRRTRTTRCAGHGGQDIRAQHGRARALDRQGLAALQGLRLLRHAATTTPPTARRSGFDTIYDISELRGRALQLLEPLRHPAHADGACC